MRLKLAAFFIPLVLLLQATPSPAGEKTIINKSGSQVTSVMISPSGQSNWSFISPGLAAEQRLVLNIETDLSSCNYDIKFTDTKGNEYFMGSVDMCLVTEITLDGSKAAETGRIFMPPGDSK